MPRLCFLYLQAVSFFQKNSPEPIKAFIMRIKRMPAVAGYGIRKNLILYITCLVFSLFSQPVSGDTSVGGGILPGNTTWTLPGSPYIVDGVVEVGNGQTLTVEAGVVVKFVTEESGITVLSGGTMDVDGAADNPVYFTDYRDDSVGGDTNGDETQPVPGSWNGLNITDGGTADIQNSRISYASRGVVKQNAGGLDMSDCRVTNADEYGIWLYEVSGDINISRCRISDTNFEGMSFWDLSGNATISQCSVTGSGFDGISIWDTLGILTLTGCTIFNNEFSGIFISDSPPSPSKQSKFSKLSVDPPGVEIFLNNIFGNDVGIDCWGVANPLIGGSNANRNNIYNNTTYGVYNDSIDIVIDSTYNCWGSLSGPKPVGNGNAVTSENVNFAEFHPRSGFDGDLNDDDSVNLADAITAFQVMTGISPADFHPEYTVMTIDINGDNRAGLAEAAYILRTVSGK
jgi:parallel beta-helix repeat protein